MTTKKKVTLAITIPIAVILIAILCLVSIYEIDILKDKTAHRDWTKIDYCNEAWDVQIPNANVEYTFSNRGWFGDGKTYTVCQYSSRPDEFLKEFKTDIEEEYINKIIDFLQSGGVDKSKLIEPDENYIWFSKIMHSNCTLILAYNEQKNTLYIIEDFT